MGHNKNQSFKEDDEEVKIHRSSKRDKKGKGLKPGIFDAYLNTIETFEDAEYSKTERKKRIKNSERDKEKDDFYNDGWL